MVSTVDGAATGETGKSGSINNEPDHRVFHLLRELCDVVVVGAGTLRTEGYVPLGKPLVVVTRSGLVPEPQIVQRRHEEPHDQSTHCDAADQHVGQRSPEAVLGQRDEGQHRDECGEHKRARAQSRGLDPPPMGSSAPRSCR